MGVGTVQSPWPSQQLVCGYVSHTRSQHPSVTHHLHGLPLNTHFNSSPFPSSPHTPLPPHSCPCSWKASSPPSPSSSLPVKCYLRRPALCRSAPQHDARCVQSGSKWSKVNEKMFGFIPSMATSSRIT